MESNVDGRVCAAVPDVFGHDFWRQGFPVPVFPILRPMETLRQSDPRQPRRWTALRVLIPWIIFSSLILNVALRFVPPQWMAFHAWEAATLYATAEGDF